MPQRSMFSPMRWLSAVAEFYCVTAELGSWHSPLRMFHRAMSCRTCWHSFTWTGASYHATGKPQLRTWQMGIKSKKESLVWYKAVLTLPERRG